MSDLAATNCGSCGTPYSNNGGSNCLWLLLILLCCGNNGDGYGSGLGLNNLFGDGNSCDTLIWLILLSSLFNRSGNNCGC